MLPPSVVGLEVVLFGELAGEHEHAVADAQLGVADAAVGHDDRLAEQLRVEHFGVPLDRARRDRRARGTACSVCKRAGVYSRTSSVGMVVCLRIGVERARRRCRRRSSRANSGRGASGTIGSRSVVEGISVIAAPFGVADAERVAGADEQRFGRVHGAAELVGDLGNGQAVEVAQRERGAVVRRRARRALRVRRMRSKWASSVVVDVGFGVGRERRLRSSRALRRQWSTSLLRATVIEPGDRQLGHLDRLCTAWTAARNVSAVRSSATASSPTRARR